MVTQAEIGNRLRARRKQLQYSQEKLASLMREARGDQTDQTAISRWELGKPITVEQLQSLASVLKTTVAALCEPASSDSADDLPAAEPESEPAAGNA